VSIDPSLTIETKGVESTVLDLVGITERAGDIRPLTDKLRAIYLRSNERHWGRNWPALADSTVQRKSQQGLSPSPEIASGALRKALTEKRAKGQRTRRKKDELRFGTSLFYARWQQGTKTQPERDLIDLTPSDLHAMNAAVEDYVAKGRTV
jgi:hypothetical protein